MKPVRTALRGAILSAMLLTAAPFVHAIDALVPPPDAGVDWRGPDDSTALHWAVYESDHERARALIRAGADVNASNRYGSNAMQLAAEMADLEMLRILLDAGADVDSPNPEGQTALMLVARTGNVEAARLLVDRGANINAIERFGEQNALMWAAARRHPAMVEYLIRQGAEIDRASIDRDYKRHVTKEGRAKNLDRGGLTPLLFAVRENCLGCVEVLIREGADLDKPDPDGVSPLVLAIINANWDIARALIEAGADVQQWDMFGHTAMHGIIGRYKSTEVRIGDPLNETTGRQILDMLLARGANVNAEVFMAPAKMRGGFSRGTTPLILAAANADVEIMKLLMEHGADATHMQADLQTPASVLAGARGNQDQMVEGLKMLVAAGADLNVRAVPHHLQRNRGGTALIAAANAGNDKVIRALVELGADINGKDIDGLTALDHAMQRNQVGFLGMRRPPNLRIAELLRELGATEELDHTPHWPFIGPPFYYPWHVWPLSAADELKELIPGSFDHQ